MHFATPTGRPTAPRRTKGLLAVALILVTIGLALAAGASAALAGHARSPGAWSKSLTFEVVPPSPAPRYWFPSPPATPSENPAPPTQAPCRPSP